MGAKRQTPVLAQQFVDHDSTRGRHIQGVLDSQHGNADVGVGARGQLGPDAVDFISENQADRKCGLPIEQVDGFDAGLDGDD